MGQIANQKAVELFFKEKDRLAEMKKDNEEREPEIPSVAVVMKKMLEEQQGSKHDINHLLKVWSYAKNIGELEGLDPKTQYTLEVAAIMHDIACPSLREKYGKAEGKEQEKEGPVIGRRFLDELSMPEEITERVLYLIGHHHTLNPIDGIDHQILIEADYFVNADECSFTGENIRNFKEKIFRTASGTALLESIFCDRLSE